MCGELFLCMLLYILSLVAVLLADAALGGRSWNSYGLSPAFLGHLCHLDVAARALKGAQKG